MFRLRLTTRIRAAVNCGLATLGAVLLLFTMAHWAAHSAARADASFGGEALHVLTWPDYIAPDVVEEFEQRFDVRITFSYFETDDARSEILTKSAGQGYDVVLVSGHDINKYQRRGWLAALAADAIPNRRHIMQRWAEAFPGTADYGVAYFWGTQGIAYRRDLVSRPITSWRQLLDPDEELRGRIAMTGTARDLTGIALKALGYSLNSSELPQLKEAEALLRRQLPFVKSYAYINLTQRSDLVSGDVRAAMVFNGDALMLQQYNDQIVYAVPEEGANLWVDYFCVLESSPRKELSQVFLNFLNEPEVAARIASYVYYATPNEAAHEHLPQSYFDNPIIYPPAVQLAQSEFYERLTPRAQKYTNGIMARLLNEHVASR